jgi:ABC-type transporter Mla subunit MlaD
VSERGAWEAQIDRTLAELVREVEAVKRRDDELRTALTELAETLDQALAQQTLNTDEAAGRIAALEATLARIADAIGRPGRGDAGGRRDDGALCHTT